MAHARPPEGDEDEDEDDNDDDSACGAMDARTRTSVAYFANCAASP